MRLVTLIVLASATCVVSLPALAGDAPTRTRAKAAAPAAKIVTQPSAKVGAPSPSEGSAQDRTQNPQQPIGGMAIGESMSHYSAAEHLADSVREKLEDAHGKSPIHDPDDD